MNHKQFESWILDESSLTADQKLELKLHLAACPECRHLDAGWQASRNLISQAAPKIPEVGFGVRWLALADRKKRMEHVRRYRLTVFSILVAACIASLAYIIASGSFMHMLANTFNSASRMIIAITNSLTTLGEWAFQLPIAIPLSIGFIFFGLVNAFIMAGLFTLWNLKQRKMQTNEIQVD